jgi:Ca2+/Na+ antiporter
MKTYRILFALSISILIIVFMYIGLLPNQLAYVSYLMLIPVLACYSIILLLAKQEQKEDGTR